jgi:quercetin dioxygenase-like cupin family protein
MMVLIEGRMRMQVGDAARGELTELEMEAGEINHFPPNMPHGGEALEDCVILDIISPPSDTTGIDSAPG